MDRVEYLVRAREFASRGNDLPHARLIAADVKEIRRAVQQREELRRYIAENLTNTALARRFGVHVRTIDRVTQFENWSHVK
jgi:hypothetical protein